MNPTPHPSWGRPARTAILALLTLVAALWAAPAPAQTGQLGTADGATLTATSGTVTSGSAPAYAALNSGTLHVNGVEVGAETSGSIQTLYAADGGWIGLLNADVSAASSAGAATAVFIGAGGTLEARHSVISATRSGNNHSRVGVRVSGSGATAVLNDVTLRLSGSNDGHPFGVGLLVEGAGARAVADDLTLQITPGGSAYYLGGVSLQDGGQLNGSSLALRVTQTGTAYNIYAIRADNGSTAALANGTFQSDSYGISATNASLVSLSNMQVSVFGYGVQASATSHLHAVDSVIAATGSGGVGISLTHGASAVLENVLVTTATIPFASPRAVTLTAGTLTANNSTFQGSGVALENHSGLAIFTNGTLNGRGDVLYALGASRTHLENVDIVTSSTYGLDGAGLTMQLSSTDTLPLVTGSNVRILTQNNRIGVHMRAGTLSLVDSAVAVTGTRTNSDSEITAYGGIGVYVYSDYETPNEAGLKNVAITVEAAEGAGLRINGLSTTLNIDNVTIRTTGSNAKGFYVGAGKSGTRTLDNINGAGDVSRALPDIVVYGDNSAVIFVDAYAQSWGGSHLELKDLSLTLAMLNHNATSWGAKLIGGAFLYFTGSGNTGGTRMWANMGRLTFADTSDGAGSHVLLSSTRTGWHDANGYSAILDISPHTGGTLNIGSLQGVNASATDRALVILGENTLRIGVDNATGDGHLLTSSTYAGTITGSGGAGALHIVSNTTMLTGTNDYTGGTEIYGGTNARLIVTHANALGSGTVNTGRDGTLELRFAGSGTQGNRITGGGLIHKSGAGAATLSNTVNAGQLLVQQGALKLTGGGTVDYAGDGAAAVLVAVGSTFNGVGLAVTASGSGAHGMIVGGPKAVVSVADSVFNVTGALLSSTIASGTATATLERVSSANGESLISATAKGITNVRVVESSLKGNLTGGGSATLNVDFDKSAIEGGIHQGSGIVNLNVKTAGGAWLATENSQLNTLTSSGTVDLFAARRDTGAVVRVNVGGNLTQTATGNLKVAVDAAARGSGGAIIKTNGASLSGTLDVTGLASYLYAGAGATAKASEVLSATANSYYIIAANGAGKITGDFDTVTGVNLTSGTTAVDYIVTSGGSYGKDATGQYYIVNEGRGGLAWNEGGPFAHGSFTVTGERLFDIDVALANRAANAATGWDGKSLTKRGAGTLVVSSTTSHTGTTNVNEGRLIVGGAIAGSPQVNVLAGAALADNGSIGNGFTQVSVAGILSGTGVVRGDVLAQNDGVISPGAGGIDGAGSHGMLTVERHLTLSNAGKLSLDLGKPASGAAAAGVDYDSLTVGGNVTLAGALDIRFELANLRVGDFFTLIDNRGSGGIAGDFGSVLAWGQAMTDEGGGVYSLGGFSFQLSKAGDGFAHSLTGGNDLVLTLRAIPEPGTWATLVGGLGVLLAATRLRRRAPQC